MNNILGTLKKPRLISSLNTTKSSNELINRLSASGAHREVLHVYSCMLRDDTLPDAHTFPSLLKACTSIGLPSHGLSIHQRIIVDGYSSDAYIATSLINMYAKFGKTHVACQIFDTMPERSLVPWTAIIGCHSRAGQVDMAFSVYNQMRQEEIQPNSVTLLGLLFGISQLIQLLCVHALVVRLGFESEILVMNSLLNVYGRCGRVDMARHLFDSVHQRDIVSWNSLLSGYSKNENVMESLELLNRMRINRAEPDQQTFGFVVSAIANQSQLQLGQSVHGQIVKAGFGFDGHVETTLVVMYLKCGNVQNALLMFNEIEDKDVISWTAMISGLVQNDRADEALNIFHSMLKSGGMPSTATIASALAACAQLGSSSLGTSIHGYIIRQKIKVDTAAENSLLTMYAKCGHLEQSWAVFDRIEDRDVVSWNAIVAGYAQNGNLDKALCLFNEMREACQRPDPITVVSLLQACASIGALHQGKWIHNFVIRNGVGPSISIDTALIDVYSKCGDINAAQRCFDDMPEHDLVSWSTMIAGYGSHGKGETALRMYSEFLGTGIEPNHVIFLAVLSACSHSGLVSQGLSVFQSMTQDFGIEPKLEHRACIVDLLTRAGRVVEAYNFVKKMFSQPSADVLGILLNACRTHRNAALADVVAREIIMLKPTNASNYVQLAQSYASRSKWDGMGEVRMQMKSLGLKKVPGWSSIELHGTIATFFVDQSSHTQYEKLMLVLNILGMEMKHEL
ncbi:pentatricopeptide repeat-containing protein At4g04370-like [Macadamia integrifolia]|uniref:pentatricopeptide repeat-containing protein At4g04370-like n=1 Tax=Macadamia integrifolia TaxID=60698 RepID=UPI001C4E3226|nr:pentatricopeptide repeat-containing protein At4g04370-like isoform X1 [Macadamia integrifolia]XP_042488052.1 pentatricopeptide repeat-containing protein At4g04370-like isoform X1 [Macadamia integrifolia]XP_042488053.1 pentatricopeptide repeat-containing protein At4g04370-like isoform X1 [Macadamia integrifolia]XP_042488054.1 pentatricopeptide repeat-containing protein At4g04370-like isoform X1 [Macadamia integrifolia]XP_042488055.1 pentatricopeptide repeat-containing protein At4g04370-like i